MSKVNTSVIPPRDCRETATSDAFEQTFERLSSRYPSGSRTSTFPHIVASPVHYERDFAYPLLVWLHDSGKTESEVFEVMPKISTRNYVAVAPRGLSSQKKRVVRSAVNGKIVDEKCWIEPIYDWPETDEAVSEAENLVFDSIAEAQNKYRLNSRRVFILGRGSGGAMALRVAMRNPREFAGVVCIDGALPTGDSAPFRNWRHLRDLPLLLTTSDVPSASVPKLDKDALRLYHTAGLTVLVRQYNEERRSPGGRQDRMDAILADVNRWIMERATNPQAPVSELLPRRSTNDARQSEV